MKNCLLFSFALILIVITFSEGAEKKQQPARTTFLLAYHGGDYKKAHELLKKTFDDETTLQIWEERIHRHEQIGGCPYMDHRSAAAGGMAELHIGNLGPAAAALDDGSWLSELGQATLAWWESRYEDLGKHLDKGLALAPDRPEMNYLAGNVVQDPQIQNEYMKKYLSLKPGDSVKEEVAKDTIEFNDKTKGLALNVASLASPFEKVKSEVLEGRPLLKGSVDGKEVKLLIDTGAGGLTLSQKKWEPKISSDLVVIGFGKEQVSHGTRAVFDQLSAGSFQLKNSVAAISPTLKGGDIDGVAGTVLFANYTVFLPLKNGGSLALFDPVADPFTLLEKKGFHFSERKTFSFYLVEKLIIVKGSIENSDQSMDLLIDTGAQNSILSLAAAKKFKTINNVLSMQARELTNVYGVGGKSDSSYLSENVEVRIGDIKRNFGRMLSLNLAEICEALDLEIDAIIGRDFLSGYTLLIDYNHNQITFLK